MLTMEWFRDLVIVLFGAVATGVFIVAAVLMYLLYKQLMVMAKSINQTLADIQSFAKAGTEAGKSVLKTIQAIADFKDKVGSIFKFFKGKDGGKNEQG